MISKPRQHLIRFAVFSFLMMALLLFPGTVQAQDETPPVEPMAPEESFPAEGDLEPPQETQAPLLGEVLSDSSVLITDSSRTPIPLASIAAEELAATADPYFTCADDSVDGTPDGICRYFGVGGIQAAVADFTARLGSGNIFIEDAGIATDYTGAVTISGISGLTGLVGTSTLTSSPSTLITLSGSINVSNQLTGFNLSGLTILGNQAGPLVSFSGNTGNLFLSDLVIKNDHASGDALSITSHTGNATLAEIKADRNGDEGAYIEVTGNTAITNSSFNTNNGPISLMIISNGSVTLNGVSASGNSSGDGASIFALKGITIRNSLFNDNYDGVLGNTVGDGLTIASGSKGAVLIENSFFRSNQETGLYINVDGVITLKTLQVTGNQVNGIYVDNCAVSGSCTRSSANVTLNNINIVGGYYPLYILSNGNINLSGVTSWYAGIGNGAQLMNDSATTPKSITVSNSDFSYATSTGLWIRSRGAVSLNKVISDYSVNGKGIDINNASGTAAVTFTNTLGDSNVDSNFQEGLYVFTRGVINITGISASGNSLNNIYLDNTTGTSSVTLASAFSSGSLTTDGIRIDSKGAISLKNVISDFNLSGKGAVLNNTTSISNPGVTITSGVFNNNAGIGLDINSKGNVIINGLETNASSGGNVGTSINTLTGPGNVTLSNATFSSNTSRGLVVVTNGTITLTKIIANYNSNTGVDLDNTTVATGSKPVTINGIDVSNNVSKGLSILSKGAVKINNLLANNMAGSSDAVYIETLGSVSIGSTGMFLNSISNNNTNGLAIEAGGAISLKNIYVGDSVNGYGANLDNTSGSGGVTIINGTFSYNKTYGLAVLSKGSILGTNVHADNNITLGAVLNNSTGIGGITINGASAMVPNTFTNNKTGGLTATSNGAISLMNINSSYNNNLSGSGNGISASTSLGNITLLNIVSNANGAKGIDAFTGGGTISLTNVTADGNKIQGTSLDNSTTPAPKSISAKNFSAVSTQLSTGLYITSNGNVTLTSIKINNTAAAEGLYVTTGVGLYKSAITINAPVSGGSTFNNNQGYGLILYTDGPISITNTEANNNYYTGLLAQNSTGNGPVTISKSQFSSNRNSGLSIESLGAITLSSVNTSSNGISGSSGSGALLNNTFSATGKITVSNSIFASNYNLGLLAYSNSTITVSNVIAEYNLQDEGILLNSTGSVNVLSINGFQNKANNNKDQNISITSGGDVTVQNVKIQYNSNGPGIQINNTSGTGKVTITGLDVSSSYSSGLYLESRGTVTISNSKAYSNSGMGFYIDNSGGTGAVTLKNSSSISNTSMGLWVITAGSTLMDKVDVLNNTITGTQVDISDPAATLTVSRSKFDNNNNGGLNATLSGNVILNNVSASVNSAGRGVSINNFAGAGTVTVLSTFGSNTFNDNGSDGLYVFSNGEFKGSNINASNNGYHGLNIFNQSGMVGVTITGGVFNRNARSGIYLTTSTNVLISGVQVMSNGYAADVPGIYVVTGGNITLSNSLTTGNGKEGIYAFSGSPATILIHKSLFFGNNRWGPFDADPNITTINGTLTIVR